MAELRKIIEIALSGFWPCLGFVLIIVAIRGGVERFFVWLGQSIKRWFPGLFN